MIDIIVLTFNQEEHTVKCLESIRKYTEDYRLVWVDNGSWIESRDVVMPYFLRHKNRLSIWSQKNLGFVGGINLALDSLMNVYKTESEYIVLQNNDTIVTNEWLTPMTKILDEDPKIAAVGPVSSVQESVHCWKRLCQNVGFKYDPCFGMWDAKTRAKYLKENLNGRSCEALENLKPPKIKMVAFFAAVIRKSVFKEIGVLDDSYGIGLCDDRDYCHRLYNAGYKCAVALDSYVEHNHNTTFKASFKSFQVSEIYENNLKRFKEKHKL